jgi:hypothetical protein
MKTRMSALLLVAVLLTFAADAAFAHGRNVNVTTRGKNVESCSDLEIEFGHRPAVRAEEEKTIARSAVSTLRIPAVEYGGVEVIGWGRDEYSVTACKAAISSALLPQVSFSVQDGNVRVQGPSDDDWLVYLIVRAPRQAALDLEAHNGPIGLRRVTGRITARATNGPISLRDCNGEIDVETRNGPVDWVGGGGNVRVRLQNGPLSVKLTGTRWEGGTFEGDTRNGPLSLDVPENYASGVRVDASKHSPVKCRATQCKQALRTWEYPNRIEFGSGAPAVRLTTVNGPVSIE